MEDLLIEDALNDLFGDDEDAKENAREMWEDMNS